MSSIPLTIAISDYDHVRDLVDGRVPIEGVDPTFLRLEIPEIFARFARYREWEVSEYGFGKYVAERAAGDDSVIAIPVFPSRIFRLTAFYVRADSPLTRAEDLVGARIGVPEWAQTAGIYARGWMTEDAGIPLTAATWVQAGVDEPGRAEKVPVRIPEGVTLERRPEDSLNSMLLDGQIDIALTAQPPAAYADGRVRRMLPDARAIEVDYARRTGLLPIMHTVAIRRDVVDAHPWVAANLMTAFETAKRRSVARLFDWKASRIPLLWGTALAEESAPKGPDDYWNYGVGENRPTIAAFLRFCHDQGIAERLLEPDELFAPATLTRVRV